MDATAGPADPRRRVPRTDVLLADPRLRAAAGRLGPDLVKQAVQDAQQRARSGELAPDEVADAAVAALPRRATSLNPVINATGVVLHTNLGRAPLSAAAVEALTAAAGYVDVEFDLADGARARRGRGTLAALQDAVPAAEDVLVVNNGAAALVLAVTALAAGREVIVSRGELVEIGDGFRLPELMQSTGARIREVGTTNRTTRADYEQAIDDDTAAIVKIHPSNFEVRGYTADVDVADLATLPLPVIADIGSGLLSPDPQLPAEPDASTALLAGAALVTASGDKLLGGPQAGLLLGRAKLVDTLRRHPLARALRVDKLTLAALEATLRGPAVPATAYRRLDADLLRTRAQRLADELGVPLVPSAGAVGGGSAPGLELPGWALALPPDLAGPLRRRGVVGRVERDRCLLDLRCVPPEQDDELAEAVRAVRAAEAAQAAVDAVQPMQATEAAHACS